MIKSISVIIAELDRVKKFDHALRLIIIYPLRIVNTIDI